MASFQDRIIDAMIQDGLLTNEQRDELAAKQQEKNTRMLKLIVDESYVNEQDLAVCMGRVLKTPPINLQRIGIEPEVAELLPKDICKNHKVLPVSLLDNNLLFLAMADPLNVLALDDIKRITNMEIQPMIATEKTILDKLDNLDSGGKASMEDLINDAEKQAELEAEAENAEHIDEGLDDLESMDLEGAGEEAPVIKMGNLILVQAIKEKASDIHIEPFEKLIRLRYRIDGALIEMTPPPKKMQQALTSRLKIMSNLDIAERRLPQDGRMRMKVGGRAIDLRVSFLPVAHGEKCVLRVLDKSNLSASIDKLGMDDDTVTRFKEAVRAPYGLLLVTGPTGSGKTTTLYSALAEVNKPDVNIVTVEDPIEFQIPGINQVPVRKEIGLTFAAALRSILRQDPDICMIGEIRDTETAEIAVEAALTGHQVLSTMHCNDAPGAVTRLDDMGVAPFLISSSVIMACAQRLLRRICKSCKEEVEYPKQMYDDLHIPADTFDGIQLYRGRGCDRCNKGYAGRVAIIEAMTVTDDIRKLVLKRASGMELMEQALSEGMKTLRMVALDKVREGVSTLEQALALTAH